MSIHPRSVSIDRQLRWVVVVAVAALVAALTASVTAPRAAAQPGATVAFVSGNSQDIPAPDQVLVDRLIAGGFVVEVVDDDLPGVESDGVGADVVVISSSVAPSEVASYASVPLPVLVLEAFLFDDLHLTTGEPGAQGETPPRAALNIVDPNHPLAAGLAGTQAIGRAPSPFSFGRPHDTALVVGRPSPSDSRAVLFAYEQAASLGDGAAMMPARRVAFPFSYGTPSVATANGLALFDAAIQWLLEGELNAPPSVDAGPNLTVTLPEHEVVLDATVADDGRYLTLSRSWRKESGPGVVSFADPGAEDTVASFSAAGTYELSLTAIDGQFARRDSVVVTVEPAQATRPHAVLIAGRGTPLPGDRPILDRMTAAGFDVRIVDDDDLATFDPLDAEVVAISTSVRPAKIGSDLNDLEVPIVVWEGYLLDDLAMSTANPGETALTHSTISVVDADHPLAAGLATSTVRVQFQPTRLTFGRPGPGADVVAHEPGRPGRAVLFAYEPGSPLVDGTAAPARRIALFPNYDGARRLSTDGVAIIDAALQLARRPAATTIRVSVATDGMAGPVAAPAAPAPAPIVGAAAAVGGPIGSRNGSISLGGRFVAFETEAALAAVDTNGLPDVYVHDVMTGTTELTSVASDGTPADLGGGIPSLSWDGRFVAFGSPATNLGSGPEPGSIDGDVFVHDRSTGATQLVSVAADGSYGDGDSDTGHTISGDGSTVVFGSVASNLHPDDVDSFDLFARDLTEQRTDLLSFDLVGSQELGGGPTPVSEDGRFVVYEVSENLGPTATCTGVCAQNVYRLDTLDGSVELVSAAADGSLPNADSFAGGVSRDGRFVAFSSTAGNLTPMAPDGGVFLRDMVAGTTTLVSVGSDPATGAAVAADSGNSGLAVVSADGNRVAFVSWATNLVPDDTNGTRDVLVRDLAESKTVRVSVGEGGIEANGPSGSVEISPDGSFVVFDSDASNLVAGDTNGRTDTFVRGPLDSTFGTTCPVLTADGDFEGATIVNCDYAPAAGSTEDLDLERLDLSSAIIVGTTFAGVDLGGADLSDAYLAPAIRGATATAAAPFDATVVPVSFTGGDLSFADLSGLNDTATAWNADWMRAVRMRDAQLSGSAFGPNVELFAGDLSGTTLDAVTFTGTTLDGVSLRHAEMLAGTVFTAPMGGSAASLHGADLTGLELASGAAPWIDVVCPDGIIGDCSLHASVVALPLVVVGDQGDVSDPTARTEEVAAVVQSDLAGAEPEAILTVGDNTYLETGGDGRVTLAGLSTDMAPYQSTVDARRVFATAGNHDTYDQVVGYDRSAGTRDLRPFLEYFELPFDPDADEGPDPVSRDDDVTRGTTDTSYDFVWGPVHVFVVDVDRLDGRVVCGEHENRYYDANGNPVNAPVPTEFPFGAAGYRNVKRKFCPSATSGKAIHTLDQARTTSAYQWLERELTASRSPWQIVTLHQSPHSSGWDHGSHAALQWPFEAWGADAVFSGHDHHYERLAEGTLPYFVVGASGTDLDPTGGLDDPTPPTLSVKDDRHGAMWITIGHGLDTSFRAGESTLTFDYSTVEGSLPSTPDGLGTLHRVAHDRCHLERQSGVSTANTCAARDQHNNEEFLGALGIVAHQPIGQEFTPTRSPLTGVDLALRGAEGLDTLTVTIHQGTITAPALATTAREVGPCPTDPGPFRFECGFEHFELSQPLAVTPGTTYVIGVQATTPTHGLVGEQPGDYAGGSAIISGVVTPSNDFLFQTYHGRG